MAITSLVGIQTAVKQSLTPVMPVGNSSTLADPRANVFTALIPAPLTSRFDNTAGIQFTNPAPGQNTYLSDVDFAALGAYYALIVDLIWSVTVANVTTLQTFTSPSIGNRDMNGTTRGDGIYLFVYNGGSNLGGGNCFLTVTYTSSDGNTGRTGISGNAGFFQGGRTTFVNMASGDNGVRSIQSAQWSALPGGGLGLFAYRPVALIPTSAARSSNAVGDALHLALPRIYDNSCLHFLYGNGNAVRGEMSFIQG